MDADTAARSLAHWSEEGRAEMEAFYAYAWQDYVELAGSRDWAAFLHGRRTLLDVACGSGKFPTALQRHADLTGVEPIAYDLLDPSAFSLAEAATTLAAPFEERARFETTMEDLDPAAGPWDVVWATHALYALQPAHLDAAAERFVAAIAPGGVGFLAQGTREGHYLRVYDLYREGVRDATPYLAAEDLHAAFERAGATVERSRLSYAHVVGPGEDATLEGYLQRCLFDDSLSLPELLEAPLVGPYLASCRTADGGYRFLPEVDCLVLTRG